MHALWIAVAAVVKLVDYGNIVVLLDGKADDFSLQATWSRADGNRKIPIAQRGLFLVATHPRETYPDCAAIGLVTDAGPVPSTVQIERGGPTCGPEGREVFTLRVARADLPALGRAKTLAIDVCGTQLPVDRRWLDQLRRLVARALADK